MAEQKQDRKAEIQAIKEKRKLIKDTIKDQKSLTGEMVKQVQTAEGLDKILDDVFGTREKAMQLEHEMQKALKSGKKEAIEKVALDIKGLKASQAQHAAMKEMMAPIKGMVKGARAFLAALVANPLLALATAAIALVKLMWEAYTAARDMRTELGGSLEAAAKTAVKLKAVEASLFLTGYSSENVKENFDAIRKNLGGIEAASYGFLVNFSKTAQITGASAENLATILSIQESVSDASRETLLAQMEANALMIEMRGIAPEAIFNDLAENADFFAASMKAGTNNVRDTAIEARKLGLNLGTVAKISESLLDFETSIEKQMEASMLLGRQINLDKARQLSFMDDHKGMIREILKQVGGEAEFAKMKGFQRKAVADAVGVSVSELSRMAKQREGEAAKPQTFEEKSLKKQDEMIRLTTYIAEEQSIGTQFAKKTADGITEAAGG